MSRNRLSGFLRPPCRCERIARRLRRMAVQATAVEKLIGDVAAFIVPSLSTYIAGERIGPRLILCAEFEPAQRGDDLGKYAASELRSLGLELIAAADRVEGGAP